MLNNFINKPLKLAKTYDNCPSKNPRLTLVFLHGIGSDSSTFNSAISYLEGTTSLKDVRFVSFDLLGSGKSLKSDKLNYDFKEQLEALDNAISDLKLKTPLVLVGHSMGTLIAERYTDLHRRKVKELILISPPIYRPADFENPVFQEGMKNFEKIVIAKNPAMKNDKAFHNELKNIILNPKNYDIILRLTRPTTLIFGLADQIIANFNIPGVIKKNPKIKAVETPGTHGVTHDKYSKMVEVVERILNEAI